MISRRQHNGVAETLFMQQILQWCVYAGTQRRKSKAGLLLVSYSR